MAAMCFLLLAVLLLAVGRTVHGRGAQAPAPPLVPALMVFGDSLVDVGNNDYIHTVFKADIPPYGRDFKVGRVATGRFSNGELLSDLIAEELGFTTSPPAYLSPEASGENLLIGANFASAAAAYYDPTSLMFNVIPLSAQMDNFKEYQSKLLEAVAGSSKQAHSIISGSLYIISLGSNDFANYYINPLLFKTQTVDQLSDLLVSIFSNTITELYGMGARRIGIFTLPPLGCTPLAITAFGHGRRECVSRLNNDAQIYIMKLNTAVDLLSKRYPDLNIAVLDIYTPLYGLATSPESRGFTEARRGCCGTGLVEGAVFLCNPKSIGTCPNATTYVWFDSVHPSEAANRVIFGSLVGDINQLVM